MERAGIHTIPQSEIATAGGGGTVEREIPIPPGAGRWTLHTIPVDGGGGDPSTFVLQYLVDGVFHPLNPPTAGTLQNNLDNVLTREDVVNRAKVIITLGATPPDGDIVIHLYVSRR